MSFSRAIALTTNDAMSNTKPEASMFRLFNPIPKNIASPATTYKALHIVVSVSPNSCLTKVFT